MEGGLQYGPQGAGWLITLIGYHYHNPPGERRGVGAQFVRDTLIKNLQEKKVLLPTAKWQRSDEASGGDQGKEGKTRELVSMEELGISYPVLVSPGQIRPFEIEDPYADAEDDIEAEDSSTAKKTGKTRKTGLGPMGAMEGIRGAGVLEPKTLKLQRFDFKVQFVWTPTPPTERAKKREEEEKAKAEEGVGQPQLP